MILISSMSLSVLMPLNDQIYVHYVWSLFIAYIGKFSVVVDPILWFSSNRY